MLYKESNNAWMYWLIIIPVAGIGLIFYRRKKKAEPITANHKSSVEPKYSEITRKTIEFIQLHYTEPGLSRQQIAAQVFITEKYLSSLFNKETGMHLIYYINKCRVDKAVELLQSTRLSVSEIAFKVGYSSLQNFNKNFKAVTSKAPSAYRNSI